MILLAFKLEDVLAQASDDLLVQAWGFLTRKIEKVLLRRQSAQRRGIEIEKFRVFHRCEDLYYPIQSFYRVRSLKQISQNASWLSLYVKI